MTTITVIEERPTPEGESYPIQAIERLKMQLDAPPSPAVLNQIIALLTTPAPPQRRRRSDAGKSREVKA